MTKKTDFDRLKDFWYKRLEDDGFVDIEHNDGSINSSSPARSTRNQTPDLRQVIQDYYSMSYHFLNEYKFSNELEKIMWEYHTEGLSVRAISKILKDTKVAKTSKTKVGEIIKKLEDIMKRLYLST